MKVAVIGSRGITQIDLSPLIPEETDEIVSGGACGVDFLAKEYAQSHGLKYTEFLPEYKLYGRAAPIIRNKLIAAYADQVVAVWDGESRGTRFVIHFCRKIGTPCKTYIV